MLGVRGGGWGSVGAARRAAQGGVWWRSRVTFCFRRWYSQPRLDLIDPQSHVLRETNLQCFTLFVLVAKRKGLHAPARPLQWCIYLKLYRPHACLAFGPSHGFEMPRSYFLFHPGVYRKDGWRSWSSESWITSRLTWLTFTSGVRNSVLRPQPEVPYHDFFSQ